MSFFSKIFARREQTPTQTVPSTQTSHGGDWASNVECVRGYRSLLVPAWYRGVSLLMQTMGQMRLKYMKKDNAGGNYVEDTYGLGADLNYILQVRPNPLMTAVQLQEQIECRKIYYGNAYVYIERNGYDDIEALWLCTSGSYNPISDKYEIVYNRPGGPKIMTGVDSRDVMHFKNLFVDYGMYYGVPVIDFAKKALEIAATADTQTLQDMSKGGRHKIIVQEANPQSTQFGLLGAGRANQNELRKITQQFSDDWMNNDAVFLSNIVDTKIISQTAQELRILEQRGYQVKDIARILGVPLIMMMEGEGGNYRMPEHATQEFLLRTIQPRIREDEAEWNSKILGRDSYGSRKIHICDIELKRLDAKGQAEIDKLHMETGWSINEIRSYHELPKIAGGDIHYVSTNLAELGSDKLRMTKSQSTATGGGEGGEQ